MKVEFALFSVLRTAEVESGDKRVSFVLFEDRVLVPMLGQTRLGQTLLDSIVPIEDQTSRILSGSKMKSQLRAKTSLSFFERALPTERSLLNSLRMERFEQKKSELLLINLFQMIYKNSFLGFTTGSIETLIKIGFGSLTSFVTNNIPGMDFVAKFGVGCENVQCRDCDIPGECTQDEINHLDSTTEKRDNILCKPNTCVVFRNVNSTEPLTLGDFLENTSDKVATKFAIRYHIDDNAGPEVT